MLWIEVTFKSQTIASAWLTLYNVLLLLATMTDDSKVLLSSKWIAIVYIDYAWDSINQLWTTSGNDCFLSTAEPEKYSSEGNVTCEGLVKYASFRNINVDLD